MSVKKWADPGLPGTTLPLARVPQGTVVYAIGDIHGRDDLLTEMHGGILADAESRPASRRVVVYLGDYVSRGIRSRQVVDMLINHPLDGFEAVRLRGNHEDMLLRYYHGELAAGSHWLANGGVEALAAYSVCVTHAGLWSDKELEALRKDLQQALPGEHSAFFRSLKVSHTEGSYHFVHAGIRPGVPLDRQCGRDVMWIRNRFLMCDDDYGATVVHGHCITPEPEVRCNRIGIDTGASESGVLTCLILQGEHRVFLQTCNSP